MACLISVFTPPHTVVTVDRSIFSDAADAATDARQLAAAAEV
jgi:hypothetical protein